MGKVKGGKKTAPATPLGAFVSERVPNPNIQELARQADIAAAAAETAWRVLPPSIHHLPKPVFAIVNGSFAMELYVKSLYSTVTLGDPSTRGHGLSRPLAKGHGPGNIFRQMHNDPRYTKLGDEVIKRYSAHALSKTYPSLQDLLDTYNGAFERFRYVFEGNYADLLTFDVDTMFDVLDFLRAAIDDLESYQP